MELDGAHGSQLTIQHGVGEALKVLAGGPVVGQEDTSSIGEIRELH